MVPEASSCALPQPQRHRLMADLRARVATAQAGTGDVERVLRETSFALSAAAFTSLIQKCAKSGEVDKALEIAQSMESVAGVAPNVVHYSALIGALGKAGRWELAEQLFGELQRLADKDPAMRPNSVTYAALAAAFVKGGQLNKAMQLVRQQVQTGPPPDRVDFSCMTNACARAGAVRWALEMMGMMHAAGYAGAVRVYRAVVAAAVKDGDWAAAVEVFLSMKSVGVSPCSRVCNMLMTALVQGKQAQRAMELLKECRARNVALEPQALRAALDLQVTSGNWEGMLSVLQLVREREAPIDNPPQT